MSFLFKCICSLKKVSFSVFHLASSSKSPIPIVFVFLKPKSVDTECLPCIPGQCSKVEAVLTSSRQRVCPQAEAQCTGLQPSLSLTPGLALLLNRYSRHLTPRGTSQRTEQGQARPMRQHKHTHRPIAKQLGQVLDTVHLKQTNVMLKSPPFRHL